MGLVGTKQSSSGVHRAGTLLEPQLKHISTALPKEAPGRRGRGGERWERLVLYLNSLLIMEVEMLGFPHPESVSSRSLFLFE